MRYVAHVNELLSPFGIDGAVRLLFPKATKVVKCEFSTPMYGSVEIDGQVYDWVLKPGKYEFMEAK